MPGGTKRNVPESPASLSMEKSCVPFSSLSSRQFLAHGCVPAFAVRAGRGQNDRQYHSVLTLFLLKAKATARNYRVLLKPHLDYPMSTGLQFAFHEMLESFR